MTAAVYKVVNYNTRTRAVISTLPIAGLSYTDTLNAAGSVSVVIPLDAPEANATDLNPGGSGLVVTRDDVPVWGGILWGLSADLSAGTLTLAGSGYLSHYTNVHLSAGYTGTMDQGAMLRAWIALANQGGSDGIATDTAGVADMGQTRTRTWTKYEFKSLGEAIAEMADDIGGYNFRFEPYWTDSTHTAIGNRLVVTPRGGSDLGITLTHRVNCNVTGVTYDSSSLATNVYVFGADTGNGEKLMGSAINLPLWNTIPAKDVVLTYADVKETQTLLDKANAAAAVGQMPIAVPTLTLYPGQYDPTTFRNGDSLNVEADYGYVALLDEFVVTERTVGIDVNGTETVTLSLANKGLFLNGDSG
jgi:hypothetical protein